MNDLIAQHIHALNIPIHDIHAQTVFAYLFSNDIPILDVYFKNQYAEPEQIRKSWILPSARAAQGQAVWLKHYYPDIFNKLAAKQETLRGFV